VETKYFLHPFYTIQIYATPIMIASLAPTWAEVNVRRNLDLAKDNVSIACVMIAAISGFAKFDVLFPQNIDKGHQ
jgi:hypothetical protein